MNSRGADLLSRNVVLEPVNHLQLSQAGIDFIIENFGVPDLHLFTNERCNDLQFKTMFSSFHKDERQELAIDLNPMAFVTTRTIQGLVFALPDSYHYIFLLKALREAKFSPGAVFLLVIPGYLCSTATQSLLSRFSVSVYKFQKAQKKQNLSTKTRHAFQLLAIENQFS